MKVKVLILNWNGALVLPRFMPSVVANTPSSLFDGCVSVEVIVADNGSTDNSRELLASDFPNVARMDLDRNYGFAEGYNKVFDRLRTSRLASIDDIYVLLNSDIETPAGWLEPLVEMLCARPDVAAVAPKLLSVNDLNAFEYAGASGGFLDFFGYPYCRGRVFNRVENDRGQYNDQRQVLWGSGACLALKASALDKAGGLDGDFFAHQEEIDWCWRAQSAGFKVMVEPRSTVFHLGAGTLVPSPTKTYLNFRNNLAMLYKNLPAGRLWFVLGVRFWLDGLLALVYLVAGQRDTAGAVWRGWRDFVSRLRVPGPVSGLTLRQKRHETQSTRTDRPVGIGGLAIVKWLRINATN